MHTIDQHLITITQRPDIVFASGQGSWLTDEGGKHYLDLMQGWAVNALGHSPAVITDALLRQSQQLLTPSPAYFNRPMLQLAQQLASLSGLERVFLASSGAEANEGAVKLARRWGSRHRGGAHEVISFADAFHGRTLAMMSASGKPGWDRLYPPMPGGFAKARLNDLDSVRRAIGPQTVAVMLELVQGEAGVVVAEPDFVRALRALTEELGLLLIVDEVQTGVGRCGHAFAFEHYGIRPDIVTLAKGLGGGVPLAALLCQERFNCFEPGDQGGTFCGNALMAAVGLAVVNEVCREDFLAQVNARAAQLSVGLQAVVQDYGLVGERGLGLLRALELPSPTAPAVVAAAQALAPTGLLLNAPRPHLLRFMPALNVSAGEIDEGLMLLRRALSDARV
jgi:acetylornithine/N-succinyldiaminopimelate aminotransferase